MSDEDQTPWLAGLPEEPEDVTYSDAAVEAPAEPAEPAKPKARIKTGTKTPKIKYEPFHW